MVNKFIIHGTMVAEPELKRTESGHMLISIRVMWERMWGNKRNMLTIDCTGWGKMVDEIIKNGKKGKRVLVVGKLITREYIDNLGKKRRKIVMNPIEEIDFTNAPEQRYLNDPDEKPYGADFTDVGEYEDAPHEDSVF